MTTAQRLSPRDRNRATERLRSLTVGVTLIGVAGTLGFSVAAAVSNPGKTVASTVGSAGSSSIDSTTSGSTGTFLSPFQSNLGLGSSLGSGRSNAVTGGS